MHKNSPECRKFNVWCLKFSVLCVYPNVETNPTFLESLPQYFYLLDQKKLQMFYVNFMHCLYTHTHSSGVCGAPNNEEVNVSARGTDRMTHNQTRVLHKPQASCTLYRNFEIPTQSGTNIFKLNVYLQK